ncbi:Wzz/FepE/Etk N-terminal domain-containing protein [Coraliomargarita algicola]|uniref:Wzz/FepE/Etk N-terminal domain-containing protein n=1 Tax=Coraliomargarita algicola TaxID=3092156 RepID=A0ABZ0RMB6_9BACT|nr:Wzz/FepE/Etk N-terminal domain-containing protein [Coraliomargarita sp. J2-16]WPJ97365.1 Wzz/FepE/Etk N-terminal domain-containing protein [Coraliomargarita sp. J2-16]
MSQASSNQFLSITDLINILRQRWILSGSLALFAAIVFAIYFLNKTPIYEAEASMVVELNADKVVNVQEVVESSVHNSSLLETAMNTHIERLKSRIMAQKVADDLSEDEQKRVLNFGPENSAEWDAQRLHTDLINRISGSMLHINWLPDSQVLRVRVQHSDPYITKRIADSYVAHYIRLQIELKGQSTDQAVSFLDEQTIELRNRLEKEEEALQNYRTQNDLVTVEQNQQIVTERLSDLSSAITKAQYACSRPKADSNKSSTLKMISKT